MKVFNALTGEKKDFHPHDEVVTMHVCGVTIYDKCYVEHAMTYILVTEKVKKLQAKI